MRVLLINQFFWPDSSATSQLLTDLARGLVDRGHEVYAISADSQYNVASAGSPPCPLRIPLPPSRSSIARSRGSA